MAESRWRPSSTNTNSFPSLELPDRAVATQSFSGILVTFVLSARLLSIAAQWYGCFKHLSLR